MASGYIDLDGVGERAPTIAERSSVIAGLNSYLPPASLRVCLDGDSITSYNINCDPPLAGAANQYNPAATDIATGQCGWFAAYQAISGNPFYLDPALIRAVPGSNSTQMAARFDSEIASRYAQFDWYWLLGGTNDYNASISKETTLANLTNMATKALQAGKTVVLITIMPRTGWGANTGSQKTEATKRILWINQKLKEFVRRAATAFPIYLVDPWVDLSDPANTATTGGAMSINTEAFADGLHPSGLGAYLTGRRVKETLPSMSTYTYRGMGPVDLFDAIDNPLGNSIVNAGFTVTTGGTNTNCNVGSNIPANITAAQSMVSGSGLIASEIMVATVAAQAKGYDPKLGNLLRVTAALASGKTGLTKVNIRSDFILTAGMNLVGAEIEGAVRIALSNLQGFAGADMILTYRSDSAGTITTVRRGLSPNINAGWTWAQEAHTLLIVPPRLVIPAGTQNSPRVFASIDLYWNAQTASAAGQADISDFQMRRVA